MIGLAKSLCLAGGIGMTCVGGCAGSDAKTDAPAVQSSANMKSGAQLWSENCTRCHNLRPPTSFSDTQWDTIVHHMRLRANLTGYEARQIVTFLKASNQ